VTLEGALLLANVLFIALGALTLVAGLAVLLLNRAMDRAKDREIAHLRIEAAAAKATAAGQMSVMESRMVDWLGARAPSDAEPPAGRPAAPNIPLAVPPSAASRPSPPTPLPADQFFSPAPAPTAASDAVFAPRHLTAAQKQRMEAILRLAPSIIMITTDGHAEPEAFADELQAIFTLAGWHVDRALYASLDRPLAPLSANLKSTPIDVAVRGAFAASGLHLTARDPIDARADREIFVGSQGPHG
jgi:hypothetical protein